MATKIVFFGNERLATGIVTTAPTLRALIASGYEVVAVVANHHASMSRNFRELEIESVARDHHIPVWLPEKPADLTDAISASGASVGVLVAYGRIVPQSVIDLFPHGILNLHPSLLPLHRGSIPIEAVILNGEPKTGVSIMQLAAQMDAGPIWGQAGLLLDGTESKQSLTNTLLEAGSELLIQVLPGVLDGTLTATPQDDTAATTDARLTKVAGQLDWHKPAIQLEREVRAFLGWPGSKAHIAGREVTVTAAHVDRGTTVEQGQTNVIGTHLLVGTADGNLAIDELKPAGKRLMSAKDFLAGAPELR